LAFGKIKPTVFKELAVMTEATQVALDENSQRKIGPLPGIVFSNEYAG
jgi:hypothetical protein